MKQAILLYNDRAGKGRIGCGTERILAEFRACGYAARAQPIDFAADPFDGNETIDLMVAAGGDGTINYVVNAMKRKGLDIPLGVIPAGTANDFAGALGMARDPLAAARQIASGRIARVDCGRVNDLWFVNICSFGLFATTSQRTPDARKRRLGKLAYILEGIKELRSMHALPLEIEADGRRSALDALIVLIFNGSTAGGFRLARGASIDDGLFDCLILERRGLVATLRTMGRYLLGGRPRGIRHVRARRLDIRTTVDEPTDVDGQAGARFPLRAECLAGGLRVVRPAERR